MRVSSFRPSLALVWPGSIRGLIRHPRSVSHLHSQLYVRMNIDLVVVWRQTVLSIVVHTRLAFQVQ